MTNFQARVLVALLYFPALLLSLFDERIFSVVVLLLCSLSWFEYLSFKGQPRTTADWVRWGALILLGSLPAFSKSMGWTIGAALGVWAVALQLYVIRAMIRRRTFEQMQSDISFVLIGFLYISLLFTLFLGIRSYPSGMEAMWFIFFVIGASDSGAYFAGLKFGRKPFFQHISPKKTVEGFWGGMISALLVGGIFHFGLRALDYHIPSLGVCLVMAVLVAAAGVYGDLFESMLKRYYGVKDSGRVMGGHGGVLDRFDAALFGAVPIFFYMVMFGAFQ